MTRPDAAAVDHLDCDRHAEVLCSLTRRMLAAARQDDWTTVSRLENTRQRVLDELLAHPRFRDRLPALAERLNAVLAMSRECILLGEQSRQSTTVQLLTLQRGRHMSRAYLQNPVRP